MTGDNLALKRLQSLSEQMGGPESVAPNSAVGKGSPVLAMLEERSKTDFPIRELTYFLDGGSKNTQQKEKIMLEIERDPIFQNTDYYDLTKAQLRERTMEKITKLIHYITTEPEHISFQRMQLLGLVDMGLVTRTGVHYALFFGSLRGQATPSQLAYWLSQGAAEMKGLIGCFAMTELAHGSNVAGLETTATFDERRDEFVIHTPHIGATKWWIGGAAHTATHTVCFARLLIKGKDHGVKTFVVPLRDTKTYNLKPGVSIGDLGKKMGRDGIDNGWIQFSNVRIPRKYMLMKHTKVDREGNVRAPQLAQLAYGALIFGRVSMAMDSAQAGKRFLTIALRYAAVRRQFSSKPGQLETKLLDYAMHQRRLIPLLSQVFAMQFASDEMVAMHESLTKKLDTVDSNDHSAMKAVIEDLKEVFSTSAGLKAFTTWDCAETIDQTRQACGGHGYSAYNGFGPAYDDWVVQCTWEGDNSILALSMGRALIQRYLQAKKGRPMPNDVKYIESIAVLVESSAGSRSLISEQVLRESWSAVAATVVKKAGESFLAYRAKGLSVDEAFEETSQHRFLAARIHTRGYMVHKFFDRIAGAGSEIKPILSSLATLFALYSIEKDSGLFLQSGYFENKQIDDIRDLVNTYCKNIREQVIPLTDAFNLSDFFINSAIGKYDGNVYVNYFEQIKRQNPSKPQAPYYAQIIKPFVERVAEPEPDIDDEDDI
ncbi:acyl-CoA oxidase-domain-containing protein [Dipodascopsis tothii]|uniref:acyl-CoA oxidase-domain-containing protein n=1 Tax=Dipodascopsis tothii TaxID=44089 RepID=UPI0034CFE5BE